ncbi:MAG: amidohydrolase family protein [Myxococcota bacterium]|nr:amidohydrolase family protein [Myxococcota bacterium]
MRRIIPILLAFGCAPPPEGAPYKGATLPVTDVHLHTGDWALIRGSTQRVLAGNFPFPFGLQPEGLAASVLSAEGVLGELDDAGIGRAGMFAVYAPRSVGVATNAFIDEAARTDPDRLIGFASLSVDDWARQGDAQLEALDLALSSPRMRGVKLAHAHQHFRMDDPRYWAIYEIAAAHAAPIYLHTGTSPFPGTQAEPPYTDPAYLEPAIQAHPDTVFILGHLGHDFIRDETGELATAVRLAASYPNVYLEPSALGSAGSDPDEVFLPEAMEAVREGGVTDKMIYGSDGPQSPGFVGRYLERTLRAMESSGYTIEEAAATLDGNFARVFGLPALGGD